MIVKKTASMVGKSLHAVIVACVVFLAFESQALAVPTPAKPKASPYKICPYQPLAFRLSSVAMHNVSASFAFKPDCIWVQKHGESVEVSLLSEDGVVFSLKWRPAVPGLIADPNRVYETSIGAPADAAFSSALSSTHKQPMILSRSQDSWIKFKQLPIVEGDDVHLVFNILFGQIDVARAPGTALKSKDWIKGDIRAPLVQLVGKPMKTYVEESTVVEGVAKTTKSESISQAKNITDQPSYWLADVRESDCGKDYLDGGFDCARFIDGGDGKFSVFLYDSSAAKRGIQQRLFVGWRGAEEVKGTQIVAVEDNKLMNFEYQWGGRYVFLSELEGSVTFGRDAAKPASFTIAIDVKPNASLGTLSVTGIRALKGSLTTTNAGPMPMRTP